MPEQETSDPILHVEDAIASMGTSVEDLPRSEKRQLHGRESSSGTYEKPSVVKNVTVDLGMEIRSY
jgi:hypothetical protein